MELKHISVESMQESNKNGTVTVLHYCVAISIFALCCYVSIYRLKS